MSLVVADFRPATATLEEPRVASIVEDVTDGTNSLPDEAFEPQSVPDGQAIGAPALPPDDSAQALAVEEVRTAVEAEVAQVEDRATPDVVDPVVVPSTITDVELVPRAEPEPNEHDVAPTGSPTISPEPSPSPEPSITSAPSATPEPTSPEVGPSDAAASNKFRFSTVSFTRPFGAVSAAASAVVSGSGCNGTAAYNGTVAFVSAPSMPTNTSPGRLRLRVSNLGTATWPSGTYVNYRLWDASDNVVSLENVQSPLPSALAGGASVEIDAGVAALAPGVWKLGWFIVVQNHGSLEQDNVCAVTQQLEVSNIAPGIVFQAPASPEGTVTTRTPFLVVNGTDPDSWPAPLTYQFRICEDAGMTVGCTTSAMTTNREYQPPTLAWGGTYYWTAVASDGSKTSRLPAPVQSFKVVVPTPDDWRLVGNGLGMATAHGVVLPYGVFVHNAVDAQLPDDNLPLQLTRTWSSGALTQEGAFGYGWLSIFDSRLVYNPSSQVLTVTYPDGRQETFGRNANGQWVGRSELGISNRVEALGSGAYAIRQLNGERVVYDLAGRLVKVEYAGDFSLNLTYTDGRVSEIVQKPSNQRLAVSWGTPACGASTVPTRPYVNEVLLPAAQGETAPKWTYKYDCTRLIEVKDPAGNVTKYNRTGSGFSSTTPEGRAVAGIASAGNWTAYNPDTLERNVVLTEPGGPDRVIRLLKPQGSGELYRQTYNLYNGVTAVFCLNRQEGQSENCSSLPKALLFDTSGRLREEAFREGGVGPGTGRYRLWRYNAAGQLESFVNENDSVKSFTYDSYGNPTSTITFRDPSTQVTSIQTYPAGPPTSSAPQRVIGTFVSPSTANVAQSEYMDMYRYDGKGRLVGRDGPTTPGAPSGEQTTYTYTTGTEPAQRADGSTISGRVMPAGLLRATQTSVGTMSNAYDDAGRLTVVSGPGNQTTRRTYDARGFVQSETVNGTATSEFTRDTAGRPLIEQLVCVPNPVTNARSRLRIERSYDRDGLLISEKRRSVDCSSGQDLMDPRTTTFAYNNRGKLVSVTTPMGATTRYAYSSANPDLLTVTTDPRGRRTITNYDYPTGRIVSIDADFGQTGSTSLQRTATFQYDAAGRLISEYDALGRSTQYTYTGDDLQFRATRNLVTSSGSRSITLWERKFDGRGNITREIRGATLRTDYLYDAEDRLVTTTLDPAGLNRSTTTLRNAAGQINGITTTGGGRESRETYTLNTSGQILSRTSWNQGVAARTITYSRDVWGNAERETSARTDLTSAERVASAQFDPLGRVTTLTGATRPVESVDSSFTTVTSSSQKPQSRIGYNAFGELTEIQDARGGITSFIYDRDGHQTLVSRPARVSPTDGNTHYTSTYTRYSLAGDLVEIGQRSNGVDRVSAFHTYDVAGNLTATARPMPGGGQSSVTTFTYDLAGQKTSSTAESGARTEYGFDSLGRKVSETLVNRVNPGQADSATVRLVTSFTYNDAGQITSTTSPAGRTVRFTTNAAGEVTRIQHPGVSNVETFEYDLNGNVLRHTDTDGTSTINTYDDLGQRTSSTRQGPGSSVTQQWAYDHGGNVVEATDGRGATTVRRYDAGNNVTAVVAPVDANRTITVTAGYDISGNRVRMTDGGGRSTWDVFDALNNTIRTVEPATSAHSGLDQRSRVYEYDDFGNLVSEKKPDGTLIERDFDSRDRLIEEAASVGTRRDVRQFTYDGSDRLLTGTTSTTATSFGWNDRNLIASSSQNGRITTIGYDADGILSSRTNPDGSIVTFALDQAGRQRSATFPGGTLTTTYEPATGLKARESWSSGGAYTYTYDGLGRLKTQEALAPDGSLADSVSYAYDANSNVTNKTSSSGQTRDYVYDNANRLVESRQNFGDWTGTTTNAYTWDAASNLTKREQREWNYYREWVTDERNQLRSSRFYPTYPTDSRASFEFDAAGQQQKKTVTDEDWELDQSTVTVTARAYDGFGQLLSEPGTTYDYDAFGRLARANGLTFDYAGTDRDASRAPNSALNGYENAFRGVDGQMLATKSGQIHRLAFSDLHGDFVGGLRSNGSATAGYDKTSSFTDFGERGALAAGTSLSAFGYQGDWTNPRSRIVNMDTRWYDPSDATFLTRDSADPGFSSPTGLNRFGYAAGNPISRYDPDGRAPQVLPLIPAIPAIPGAVVAGAAVVAAAAAALSGLLSDAWEGVQIVTAYVTGAVVIGLALAANGVNNLIRSLTSVGATGSIMGMASFFNQVMANAVTLVLDWIIGRATTVAGVVGGGPAGGANSDPGDTAPAGDSPVGNMPGVETAAPPPVQLFDPTRITTTITTVGVAATGNAIQGSTSITSPTASCGLNGTASTCILPTPGLIPACASSGAGMGVCAPAEPIAGRPGAVSGVTEMGATSPAGAPGPSKRDRDPGCKPQQKSVDDPVKPYDVGTYAELKKRSPSYDDLDIHHLPQAHPAGQVVNGYSRKNAPAIALPKIEHDLIPTQKGAYDGTLKDLIHKDLADLREYTSAPDDAISALEQLIEETLTDGC